MQMWCKHDIWIWPNMIKFNHLWYLLHICCDFAILVNPFFHAVYITNYICSSGELALAALLQITVCAAFLQRKNYCARSRAWIWMLSGCLPKILIAQIGHKIDFLQILCVNYTLSGYFKNAFRLGSKCFLLQFTRGVPWWTKMDTLLVQKCQFSMTLVTPHNN